MAKLILILVSLSALFALGSSHAIKADYDRRMHPNRNIGRVEGTEDAAFWKESAQAALKAKLLESRIEAEAKNVVFFLGDGMSVPTITAARILKGQKVDNLPFGEEGELHMDSFPNTGVSKTFCADVQVADSACSATAYLTGAKANTATIGVTPDVLLNDCYAQANVTNQLDSIIAWAQAEGKSTGVVTTTRITHASPSGTYAHIANRDWENDAFVASDGGDPKVCEDIAAQLITRSPGQNIDVILGGGRRNFVPTTERDPESNDAGYRRDGQNLIEMWKAGKDPATSAYVTGRDALLAIDTTVTKSLLGLFAPSHLAYYHQQEADNDPSLEDMTKVAIEILSKNSNGFFLFVEGGRIDHAHHDNYAQRALWETVEFDKAIKHADTVTDDQDTLIVITADHAHIMTIAGYPDRGNPIMGLSPEIANDGLPYSTLSYINGPGYRAFEDNHRPDLTNDPLEDIFYQQPSMIPLGSETHGGDDVLIISKGPFGHLLTGVQQQSYIPHVIGYAACVGEGERFCSKSS